MFLEKIREVGGGGGGGRGGYYELTGKRSLWQIRFWMGSQ